MQVIIRFSLDGDQNGALWNRLNNALNQAGFIRGGNTATHRHPNIDADHIRDALHGFWNAIATHNGPGQIDHFWMYSDEAMFLDALGVAPAQQHLPDNDL